MNTPCNKSIYLPPHFKPANIALNTLFHLIFHPTLWRQRLHQQCADISPIFTWFDVRHATCQHNVLSRLLLHNYLFTPLLTALLVAFLLWMAGWGANHIQLGVVCAWVWHLTSLSLLGLSLSVSTGIIVGTLGGLAMGLSLGGLHIGLLPVAALNLGAIGVACSVLLHLLNEKRRHSLSKETGSIIIGVLVSAGILWLGYALALILLPGLTEMTDLDNQNAYLIGIIAWLGLAIGWLSGGWRWGILFGAAFAAIIWGFFLRDALDSSWPENLAYALNDTFLSASLSLLLNGLFVLPYLLARRLADMRAGIAAGSFVVSGLYLFVAWNFQVELWVSCLGPGLLLLGLSQSYWRPWLLYPFCEAWNLLTYQAEVRRFNRGEWSQEEPYLRFHTAFWDEQQRLPLYSLERHLVCLFEHAPDIAPQWLDRLGGKPQAWVISVVYQELDIRQMEQVNSIEDISHTYQHLHSQYIGTANGAVLQQFKSVSHDVEAALAQSSHYAQRMMLNELETRFNQLLLDLNRHPSNLTQRFYPLAMVWREYIIQAAQSMEALANDLQEIHNPYVVGIPLTAQQNIFVGRRDVIARIEKLLLDQRCPPILLYGQRRTGKTSVLNNLSRLLSSRFLFAYVDFQSPRLLSGDISGLLYGLAHALSRATERYPQHQWPQLEREALNEHPFDAFDAWLDQVESALEEHTLLIALDEFVTLEEARSRGHLSDAAVFTFLSMLRHIIQHRQRFRLLLAGSHSLDELNRWASYLINVQIVHLGFLSSSEAQRLIEKPVEEFSLRYSEAAAQRVLEVTHAHPALVQLLCSEIVELKNTQPIEKRRLAALGDVEDAIPQALMTGAFFFNDIAYNQIEEAALDVLHFIAKAGEEGCVRQTALQEKFSEGLLHHLKQLKRRELIENCGSNEHPAYRIQVEMIRRSVEDL